MSDADNTPVVEEEELDEELLAEFVVEWEDHIQNAEVSLLALEQNPSERDALDAVFRAFHSIKGAAGFLNQPALKSLAHRAEGLLDLARQREIVLSGHNASLALRALDAVRWFTEEIRHHPRTRECVPGYDELMSALQNPECTESADGVRSDHDGNDSVGAESADGVRAGHDGNDSVGAESADGVRADHDDNDGAGAESAAGATAGGRPGTPARAASTHSEPTIRVRTDRLDGIIDMVGELVVTQTIVNQHPTVLSGEDTVLSRHLSLMGKITRELHDLSMSLRMVPLHNTFHKMKRLVRDLSRSSNKSVDLVTAGEDTEIDRTVVELINDPLIHMLRNAVDHGLESTEDRVAAGKSERGRISLRAFHADGNVVIELEDDGCGIDRDRILKKAVERGLVAAGASLSESDALKLMFEPGFSTADKITDVSGRGVGMDVVRRNVEAAHGHIDIESSRGRGTCLTMRFPLTLAVVDGMIVDVGGEQFVVPAESVERVLMPGEGTVSTVHGRGEILALSGRALPVLRVGRLLGVHARVQSAADALALVVASGRTRYALLVDRLVGKQQLVVKPLAAPLGGTDGVSGAAILGDGRVGIILDTAGLRRLAADQSPGVPPPGTGCGTGAVDKTETPEEVTVP